MPSQPPQAQLRSGDGASRRHCPTLSPRGRPSSHLGSWAPGLSVAPPEVPSRWPGQHSQGEGEDALGGGTGEKKARDIASAPPPPRQTPTPPLRARKGFPSSRHPGRSPSCSAHSALRPRLSPTQACPSWLEEGLGPLTSFVTGPLPSFFFFSGPAKGWMAGEIQGAHRQKGVNCLESQRQGKSRLTLN